MTEPLVQLRDLEVVFRSERALMGRSTEVRAVAGVNLDIMQGETLCLVGESGSGKTTTARAIGRLTKPTRGTVSFEGTDVLRLRGKALRDFRRRVQFVFQDPYEALNPRQRVGAIVSEPLEVHGVGRNRRERDALVIASLEACGLTPGHDFARRYPHELSGGQRQRVCIAAATVLRPQLLIADEPVSMLDVSVRAGVIQLLLSLRKSHNLTLLFVTHDLSLAWAIGDRIAVMYAGRLLELGSPNQVILEPAHPYTAALIASIPEADPDLPLLPMPMIAETFQVGASGCCFRARCPYAVSVCETVVPVAEDVGDNHLSACLRSRDIREQLPKIRLEAV